MIDFIKYSFVKNQFWKVLDFRVNELAINLESNDSNDKQNGNEYTRIYSSSVVVTYIHFWFLLRRGYRRPLMIFLQ